MRIVKVSTLKLLKFQTVMIVFSHPKIDLWFLYWRVKFTNSISKIQIVASKYVMARDSVWNYTAHTLTVPVVCHFGHFVKKNWTGKLFILRSSYVQQSMLTKLKLVVWRKTLIRRLSEKHLGTCFQDMSKVNFILRHLGKTFYLILGFLVSAVVRRADWNGVVKDAQL